MGVVERLRNINEELNSPISGIVLALLGRTQELRESELSKPM